MPPPPELMDELIEEILFRLPPSDPASLVRAALVCRHWCHLVSDPGFRHRFREFHHAPPMLGFLYHQLASTCFKPTGSFHPRKNTTGCRHCRVLDARHGRILLYHDHAAYRQLIVWNPITGKVRNLPMPWLLPFDGSSSWTAALVCTAAACNHLDCPCGPFLVVFVGTDDESQDSTNTCVYPSEATGDSWIGTAYVNHPFDLVREGRSALVGNALYFQLGNGILEYQLGKEQLSVISLPSAACNVDMAFVMAVEGGRLGFAAMDGFNLRLWLRDSNGWTSCRVIDLKSLLRLPVCVLSTSRSVPHLIAFAECASTAFIWDVDIGTCAVDLKSGQVTKLLDALVYRIVPYMSFCTPALGIASTNEGPGAGASTTRATQGTMSDELYFTVQDCHCQRILKYGLWDRIH